MAIKVGINGFGRIGRNCLRTALGDDDIEFVAVNDLTDPKRWPILLKYDSILGNLQHKITATADAIKVDGKKIGCSRKRSGEDRLGVRGRAGRDRVHRPVHQCRRRKKHLRGTVKKSSSRPGRRVKT